MTAEEDFIRSEQDALWSDLTAAIWTAIDGAWSIKAANTARRIVAAARLVGPTSSSDVDWAMLAGGVYEAVLRAGGLPVALPDAAEWLRLETLMNRYGTLTEWRDHYARTVATLSSPREQRWIAAESSE